MQDKKPNLLHKLSRKLYQKNGTETDPDRRSTLSQEQYEDDRRGWDMPQAKEPDPASVEPAETLEDEKEWPEKLTIFLYIALVFFGIALIIFSLFFFLGGNTISGSNILLEVEGPSTIAGGEEFELSVTVANRNNIPMRASQLVIVFPEGARTSGEESRELNRYTADLGTINQGGSISHEVSAVLFGNEDTEHEIKVLVEYRIEDSNAIFEKEATYPITISSSPVSIEIEANKETVSGQQYELTYTITSNASETIEDAAFKIEYPFGFTFDEADPDTTFGDFFWALGDLAPESKQTITIQGTLEGNEEEERIFRAFVGTENTQSANDLSATFVSNEHEVVITKPFINSRVLINGSGEDTVAVRGGERVTVEVEWRNNLDEAVHDFEIAARLSGGGIARETVDPSGGFYQSTNDTVFWSKSTRPQFSKIDPGDSGTVRLMFDTKELQFLNNSQDATIGIETSVSGKRIIEDRVPENIEATDIKQINLAGDLLLNSRIVHSVGSFSNTGPIPPEVGEKTTYTVIWSINNSLNPVSGARVRASLPPYVEWEGETSGAGISFNEGTGEVTWDAGEVAAGAGISGAAPQVSFQIGFIPSLSQVGDSPTLIRDQILTGRDRFAGIELEDTDRALTTQLRSDPNVGASGWEVVE